MTGALRAELVGLPRPPARLMAGKRMWRSSPAAAAPPCNLEGEDPLVVMPKMGVGALAVRCSELASFSSRPVSHNSAHPSGEAPAFFSRTLDSIYPPCEQR